MLSAVIDGSVTNSKSSRTVITATLCFRKKSGEWGRDRQTAPDHHHLLPPEDSSAHH